MRRSADTRHRRLILDFSALYPSLLLPIDRIMVANPHCVGKLSIRDAGIDFLIAKMLQGHAFFPDGLRPK